MSNADIVKQIYEMFARGDGPGILGRFRPDIEFRLAEGHPYRPDGKPWIGSEAVAQNFFMRSAGEWENWQMNVIGLLEAGNAVVAEGRYTGLYKPSGNRMDVQVCHVWRFREDKVASFHQYLDTARLQDVMRTHSL